jgi:hypothetical protein
VGGLRLLPSLPDGNPLDSDEVSVLVLALIPEATARVIRHRSTMMPLTLSRRSWKMSRASDPALDESASDGHPIASGRESGSRRKRRRRSFPREIGDRYVRQALGICRAMPTV